MVGRDSDTTTNRSFRLGVGLFPSPAFQIILSGIHQRQDSLEVRGLFNRDPALNVFTTDTNRHIEASSGEAAALWRNDAMTLISGGGHFSSHSRAITSNASEIDETDPTSSSTENRSVENLYSYLFFTGKRYLVQVGLSAEFMREPNVTRRRVNPKLGVVLSPIPNFTVRAAFFETIKRPLIANQTIEPTHVAGFNQFFDDPNLTIARRSGIAVDHQPAPHVAWGAEVATRRLRIPVPGDMPKKEQLHRLYLSATPSPRVAFSVGYDHELNERHVDDPSPEGFIDVSTRRIPFGIAWFSESGLALQLIGNLVRQHAKLRINPASDLAEQRNSFVVVDASLRYRLPGRIGTVSVGIKNAFDKRFHFQEIDQANPRFAPERFGFVRASLVF